MPTIHAFELINPKTGKVIGYLSAQWNLRRFLIGRRDYAIKMAPGNENYLDRGEIVGVLTSMGKINQSKPKTESSSNSSSGK